MTTYVLIHSPLLGPRSWGRVPVKLRDRQHDVILPDLGVATMNGDARWERLVHVALTNIEARTAGDQLMLAAHSNAGALLPQIADRCGEAAIGCVFVDAILPDASQSTSLGSATMLRFLADLSHDGVLPAWTQWWNEADVAELFPDPVVRAEVEAEQPRLPFSYFEQQVPVPCSWESVRSAYLRLSDAYDEEHRRAQDMGWPVDHLAGDHLMTLRAPEQVVARLTALVNRLRALR